MKKVTLIIAYAALALVSCRSEENEDSRVQIPDFNFPTSIAFEANLSAYSIFSGLPSNLVPSSDFELLELSSVLFTDYAYKQRLIKVPSGTKLTQADAKALDFPDGTILTKTFFYYNDDRDTSLGKRIVETRLLIKEQGLWNIASYLWNEDQTDATLVLDGKDLPISWTDSQGKSLSTSYHVPSQNECMTCHQTNSTVKPIGPSLLNLNRTVVRDGNTVNQLAHLQSQGQLEQFSLDGIPQMVDYKDVNASLSDRGRAYLAMNCAHCHNPSAWNTPADKEFDFRHDIPLGQTGIQGGKDKISRNIMNGEMPFIGTTMVDEEGTALILDYLNSL